MTARTTNTNGEAGDFPPGDWRSEPGQLVPDVRAVQARARATRGIIIAGARLLFARDGFHAMRTEELVAMTEGSRGRLYHHFATKEDIFEAVARQIASEIPRAVADATRDMEGNTWPRTIASLRAHLAIMAGSTEIQRILLIDGPVVLGWARWRDLLAESYLADLVYALQNLVEKGFIAAQPTVPLAHLLFAALNDASLLIAHSKDRQASLVEMSDALVALVTGLKFHDNAPGASSRRAGPGDGTGEQGRAANAVCPQARKP